MLVTVLPSDRATLWQVSITIQRVPDLRGLNLVAILQRELAGQDADGETLPGRAESGRSSGESDDYWESFTTADGRDGVALHTSLRPADTLESGLAMSALDELGQQPATTVWGAVHAVVALRSCEVDTHRIALVTGICPTLAERSLLAVFTAAVTVSIEVGDGEPPGPLLFDGRETGADACPVL